MKKIEESGREREIPKLLSLLRFIVEERGLRKKTGAYANEAAALMRLRSNV